MSSLVEFHVTLGSRPKPADSVDYWTELGARHIEQRSLT